YKNRKTGVGCGLGNVMKTREGEPLGGGASAASDFADVGQAVAQPNYATPVAPAAQAAPAINPITGLPM
ncbi:MAG: DUF2815 family protein, partial [Oscillospiraceae bacterium]|nr:DUF2815 family protein [Oscillospiraceae bacterium]